MPSKSTIASRLTVRRGLSESESAVYLSVSPSFFRRLVGQGIMPLPRVIGGRRIWDIGELDAAFLRLPRQGDGDQVVGSVVGDSWSDFE